MIFLRLTRHFASMVTLVALLGSYPYSKQRNPNTDRQNTTPTQAPSAPTTTININQTAPEPNQPTTQANTQQANSLWDAFLVRLVDPVTWFTGLLLVFSILQWKAVRRQANTMEGQLTATEEAADAAKQSAEVAAQQIRLLRPVVVVENWHDIKLSDGVFARAEVKNYGGSIATDVQTFARHDIEDTPLNGVPDDSRYRQGPSSFLAPSGTNEFTISAKATKDDLRAVNDKTKFWNAWGLVAYKTPFGRGVTRFGVTYNPDIGTFALTDAEGFNTTEHVDEDPERQGGKPKR